tara:strand:+ start:24035 stop:25081 length:1047 start_codon:yes stop_codon:yes gene_type:complete
MAILSSRVNQSDQKRSNSAKISNSSSEIENGLEKPEYLSRPKSLDQFIGQEKLKFFLKICINASRLRKDALDHILFFGQPGLGKTTLALVLAKEMGVNCKVTSAPNLERPRDIIGLLMNLKEGEILFIDEIHCLKRVTEEILYSAMEDFYIDLTVGANRGTRIRRVNLPKFTLVGATTKLGSISSPLRDRFGICQKIDPYSINDLEKIINQFGKSFGLNFTENAIYQLASRSRGTPRIAIHLLKRVRDFAMVMANNLNINEKLVNEALEQQQIDAKGLDLSSIQFLTFILNNYDGGPVGLETIAAGLGEESSMIESVIEPYLLQLGFLSRTSRGRVLTKSGRNYILGK